ncbi:MULTISPECIES: hypothetical protein [unclassified Micromonospora]|uniref:hypothetical protein n=1 Tax=unclassified Micromonospora TaxID=2617518 RepID=UPI00332B41BC
MLGWLERTALAEAIRSSMWAYPALEIVHLLGLALLVGTAVLFDLRLLGADRTLPVRQAAARLLPLARTGFGVAALSGALMFVTGANEFVGNPAFQLKIVLLAVAGVNVLVFHLGIYRNVRRWETSGSPLAARAAAGIFLAAWTAIVACGRLIAYV